MYSLLNMRFSIAMFYQRVAIVILNYQKFTDSRTLVTAFAQVTQPRVIQLPFLRRSNTATWFSLISLVIFHCLGWCPRMRKPFLGKKMSGKTVISHLNSQLLPFRKPRSSRWIFVGLASGFGLKPVKREVPNAGHGGLNPWNFHLFPQQKPCE